MKSLSFIERFELISNELTKQGATITLYDEKRGLWNVNFEGKDALISVGLVGGLNGLTFGNGYYVKKHAREFLKTLC